MDTLIDWQRELDSSFGRGEDMPAGHYVDAGRSAVRRRRASATLVGLAVVVAIAGGAWSAVHLAGPDRETRTASQVRGVDRPATEDLREWREGEMPARALVGGDGVEIRPGAVVHERREDLFPARGTDSVALDLTFAGERWWIALEWDDAGTGGAGVRGEEARTYGSFDAFVADMVGQGGLFFGPGAPPAAPGNGPDEAER